MTGWPLPSLLTGTVNFNDWITKWGLDLNFDDTMLTEIRQYITDIETTEQNLRDAQSRTAANSIGHGEVRLNREEINQLKMERRRLKRELSVMVNVPLYN